MSDKNFAPWPFFSEEEGDAVRSTLLSNKVNYWTGEIGREFEEAFAAFVGTQYSVAVSNGTLALELALKALGVGPGDEVIVPSRTFLASASAIVSVGAKPIFADVDLESQNITVESVKFLLSPRTKAIICVHLAGWPCEMDEIMDFANNNGLYVVEDCAQAHGALYKGRSVGSIGHVGAWSFCQDKIMTTGGEGGMVTTNSRELWLKMWSYKDHGKNWESVYESEHPPGFRWLHDSFGTNWRLTEMQSVIGLLQLNKMEQWNAARLNNTEKINTVASELSGLRTPSRPDYIRHACYKYYVFVNQSNLKKGWGRNRIMSAIACHGVPCFSGSCSEIYLEKAFDNTGCRPKKRLPNAKLLGETSLMFLVHPTLSVSNLDKTCEVLAKVMKKAQN